MGGDATSAATDVDDLPETRGFSQLGECGQHRLVQWGLCPKIGKESAVVSSHGIVCRLDWA